MKQLDELIFIADVYTSAVGIKPETTSSRVFDDGKKLASLKAGGDITITRWHNALNWFSAHWPDGVEWPKSVIRPEFIESQEPAQ